MKRISKLFVLRGGIDYVERLIRQSDGTVTKLRAGGYQSIFGLDVSGGQTAIERIRQRYQAEINDNTNNIIKLSDKHSKQGAFSDGNKYSRGVDLSPYHFRHCLRYSVGKTKATSLNALVNFPCVS